ncbi:MAG: hypothetical protein ABL940_11510 [Bacteroidia bacterium]
MPNPLLKRLTQNKQYTSIAYFFPIQLLLVHLKKNQSLVFFWLLLFGLITQSIAPKYGTPYLFLTPEYLGKVNYVSFGIIGFSCGGFILAYNLASYIRNSYRFPFLATLSNPFIKYYINNSILPIVFLVTYMGYVIHFQRTYEFKSITEVAGCVAGFLSGFMLFQLIGLSYFIKTNKDIVQLFGIGGDDKETSSSNNKTKTPWKTNYDKKEDRDWYVETYFSSFTRIRRARAYAHYDKQMLRAVYSQNHSNSTLFQTVVFISLIGLGLLRDYPLFSIPAGASAFLAITMGLMISNAVYPFLRGWTTIVGVITVFSLNYLSTTPTFRIINKLEGVSYSQANVPYNNTTLNAFENDDSANTNDYNTGLAYLNNWHSKVATSASQEKPKLIIINTTGGGLRSTGWSTRLLSYTDSTLNHKLFTNSVLLTGASGGAIGLAFWRQFTYEKIQHPTSDVSIKSSKELFNNVTGDILNSVMLSVATNDLFFRLKHVTHNGETYTKDRGFALQDVLNKNTSNCLNKPLSYYAPLESKAAMPMLVLSPTIMNDGRRLLISPQPLAYLTKRKCNNYKQFNFLNEAVEYTKLFKHNNPMQLPLISALRLSASFPLISPTVALPTTPYIEVMDAGVRDNFGVLSSIQFLHTFKTWIAQNTSGVVLVQVRDRVKQFEISTAAPAGVAESFISPFGNYYGNMFHIQDYSYDEQLKYIPSWLGAPFDVVEFNLKNSEKENISLSWHLTTKEKLQIYNSVNEADNVKALKRLKVLVGE